MKYCKWMNDVHIEEPDLLLWAVSIDNEMSLDIASHFELCLFKSKYIHDFF